MSYTDTPEPIFVTSADPYFKFILSDISRNILLTSKTVRQRSLCVLWLSVRTYFHWTHFPLESFGKQFQCFYMAHRHFSYCKIQFHIIKFLLERHPSQCLVWSTPSIHPPRGPNPLHSQTLKETSTAAVPRLLFVWSSSSKCYVTRDPTMETAIVSDIYYK
jgi:hypothetical protein